MRTFLSDPFTLGLQDYDGALNSLRVGKSYLWAVMLLPLLNRALQAGARGAQLLAMGLAGGSALAGAAIVWERAAFTGLLDFSSDYRATGLFWEMHVGGAALDGFMALTMPFAIGLAMEGRTPLRRAIGIVVALLAGYGCVTTFSRGLYAGAAVGVALLAILLAGRQKYGGVQSVLWGAFGIALVAAGSYIAFRHGGYRSTLAVCGLSTLAILAERASFCLQKARYLFALGLGLAGGGCIAWLAPESGKLPYVFYAATWMAAAVAALIPTRLAFIAVALFAATAPLAANVAWHWGGRDAFVDGVIVAAAALSIAGAVRLAGVRVFERRTGVRTFAIAGLAAVTALTVVFSAGSYVSDRFATSEQDFAGRVAHWRAGMFLLRTTSDWIFGKGFGRFPQEYYFGVPGNEFPGRHRFAMEPSGNHYVTLTGPNHVLGFGELYRLSQRVHPRPDDTFAIALAVRAEVAAGMHIEVCEQHLLYNGNCAGSDISIPATNGAWQQVAVKLRGHGPGRSSWIAPKLAFFSIALTTRLHSVDIDNIRVVDSEGGDLVANGTFEAGGQRWFFVSDRYHLPWHIKSFCLGVLFETGWIGVTLLALALLMALYRVMLSPARTHPLAPFIAAGLTGFLIVGLFDTLLDAPRVALLFYMLLLTGLFLPHIVVQREGSKPVAPTLAPVGGR